MLANALASILPTRHAADYGPLSDFWYAPVGTPSSAGVAVKADNALGTSAVFACVRLLSEIFGSLDFSVRAIKADGRLGDPARDHYLYDTLLRRPNRWQTAIEWGEMGMAHILLRGNFYCRIVWQDGQMELIPLNPDRMKVEQLDNYALRYTHQPKIGERKVYQQGEILHVRGLSLDGVTGVSVLEFAKNAVGSAIAQETHGASLFRNGGLPTFWIGRPAGSKFTPDARKNFRVGWRKIHGGAENAGNPPILEDGMELHELGLTNRDSQWIEARQFQGVEICRFFRVPPHMIGILQSSPRATVEQMAIEFVRFTLFPWSKRWTQAIDRDCVDDPRAYGTHVDLDQIQKGDRLTRFHANNIAVQGGWLMVNEARNEEGLTPIEGGDTPRYPLNMQPAGGGPDWNEQGGQPGKGQKKQKGEGGEAKREEEDDEEPTAYEKRKQDRAEKREKRKKKTAAAFATLLTDAAARIAAAEIRTLSVTADKAAADRPRWDQRAADFYAAHRGYVRKTLAPIATAWMRVTNEHLDVEDLAERICTHGLEAAQTMPNVSATLAGWESSRPAAILDDCYHSSYYGFYGMSV